MYCCPMMLWLFMLAFWFRFCCFGWVDNTSVRYLTKSKKSSRGGTSLDALEWTSHSTCSPLDRQETSMDVSIAEALNCPVCLSPDTA